MGGAPASMQVLDAALTYAPRLVAVDGGADTVLAAGRMPESVVGDLDSLSAAAREAFADRLFRVPEQDSTDFAKALGASEAPFTLAVGFTGARSDHFLACLSVMAGRDEPVILLDQWDAICIAPPRLRLDLAAGTRLSLWPLGPGRGRSAGLHWPLDGIDFAPTGRVGTSNRADGPVTLTLEGGPFVLTVPARVLPRLLAGLEIDTRRHGPPRL